MQRLPMRQHVELKGNETDHSDPLVVQHYYDMYLYEKKKSYRSWGEATKSDSLTIIEFTQILEWFLRFKTVTDGKEQGILLRSVVDECIMNSVFHDTADTIKFFESMDSHQNGIISMMELVDALAYNSSFNDMYKLRKHIRKLRADKSGTQRKKDSRQESVSSSAGRVNDRDKLVLPSLPYAPETCSNKSTARESEESNYDSRGSDRVSFFPSVKKPQGIRRNTTVAVSNTSLKSRPRRLTELRRNTEHPQRKQSLVRPMGTRLQSLSRTIHRQLSRRSSCDNDEKGLGKNGQSSLETPKVNKTTTNKKAESEGLMIRFRRTLSRLASFRDAKENKNDTESHENQDGNPTLHINRSLSNGSIDSFD